VATVYTSRSRKARNRLLIGAAVVVLVLAGFLIGRLQSEEPSASPAAAPPAVSSAAPPAEPTVSSAPPPPPDAVDAFQPLQVEKADEVTGIEMQDTGDEGGGQNGGWINSGD
jgi:hypothetical protein